jgi:hypothetical protein
VTTTTYAVIGVEGKDTLLVILEARSPEEAWDKVAVEHPKASISMVLARPTCKIMS